MLFPDSIGEMIWKLTVTTSKQEYDYLISLKPFYACKNMFMYHYPDYA
jgi:hypothetical protein